MQRISTTEKIINKDNIGAVAATDSMFLEYISTLEQFFEILKQFPESFLQLSERLFANIKSYLRADYSLNEFEKNYSICCYYNHRPYTRFQDITDHKAKIEIEDLLEHCYLLQLTSQNPLIYFGYTSQIVYALTYITERYSKERVTHYFYQTLIQNSLQFRSFMLNNECCPLIEALPAYQDEIIIQSVLECCALDELYLEVIRVRSLLTSNTNHSFADILTQPIELLNVLIGPDKDNTVHYQISAKTWLAQTRNPPLTTAEEEKYLYQQKLRMVNYFVALIKLRVLIHYTSFVKRAKNETEPVIISSESTPEIDGSKSLTSREKLPRDCWIEIILAGREPIIGEDQARRFTNRFFNTRPQIHTIPSAQNTAITLPIAAAAAFTQTP